jgi:hypothetical protein
MPEPSRPPWKIAGDIADWAVWQLADMRITVVIACDACHHTANWSPDDLRRRLSRYRGRKFQWFASRLRCSQCRSPWVRVSAAPGSMLGNRPPIWG